MTLRIGRRGGWLGDGHWARGGSGVFGAANAPLAPRPSDRPTCNAATRLYRVGSFTLVELIVVLAIITIVFGMSIPWFSQILSGRRLNAAVREVIGVLQTARSYAITQGSRHSVVFELGEEEGQEARYYIADQDGRIVEKPFALPAGASFSAPAETSDPISFKDDQVVFFNTGAAAENGTVWIFDGRGKHSRIAVSELTGNVKADDVE